MSKAAELAKAGETLTNQPSGRKNIVTNGAMQIAQRGTSSTGLGAAAGYFTCDRWKIDTANSAGRFTMTQTADGPSGFANCIKLDCTTADTSIAAGEYLILAQKLEGQDLQQLKKGTSDAEKVTVSFYVKGNASATYILELIDRDNERSVSKTFSVTTDWARVELTFPADTTGALDDDNAASFDLQWWFHSGSTYNSGTLQQTWAGTTSANRAAGGDSFFDSTDREFFITGVQMEIGSQATNFEHRSFGEELALCERYFQSLVNGELVGSKNTAARMRIAGKLKPQMRATPTVTRTSNDVVFQGVAESFTSTSTSAAQAASSTNKNMAFDLGGFSSLADRSYGGADNQNDPVFNCDAEL